MKMYFCTTDMYVPKTYIIYGPAFERHKAILLSTKSILIVTNL